VSEREKEREREKAIKRGEGEERGGESVYDE